MPAGRLAARAAMGEDVSISAANQQRGDGSGSLVQTLDEALVGGNRNGSDAASTIKRRLVGGPLVGRRLNNNCDHNNNNDNDGLPSSWRFFAPIITPAMAAIAAAASSNEGDASQPSKNRRSAASAERFILLPHAHYITVLAYQTGIKVATLVPKMSDERSDVIIESVCLAHVTRSASLNSVQDVIDKMEVDGDDGDHEEEGNGGGNHSQTMDDVLVLVGCRDGTVREFSLLSLMATLRGSKTMIQPSIDCGGYQISRPFLRPRRVVHVVQEDKPEPVIHIAIPEDFSPCSVSSKNKSQGMWMYCLTQSQVIEQESTHDVNVDHDDKAKRRSKVMKGEYANLTLSRVIVPPFDGSTDIDLTAIDDENLRAITELDRFKCRVDSSNSHGARITRTVPFRMLAVTRPAAGKTGAQSQVSVFVVVAKANALVIYHELLNSSSGQCQTFLPLWYPFQDKSQLTAVDISLNKADVTCGHRKGKIRVMNNLLEQVEEQNLMSAKEEQLIGKAHTKPVKPALPPRVIVSKAHWHAHPVASLAYDATSSPVDPLLYSGGDESVLVTWQISQGKDRPADVLPRLALGGIVHVVTCSRDRFIDDYPASGILVFCEDNSLQLIESHNKSRVWKIHGLAATQQKELHGGAKTMSRRDARIEADPRSSGQRRSHLVVTGLTDAPGLMHWYDPVRERLSSKLEVAPFNRISRTEPDEAPLPTPWVTSHAFSGQGNDLITIDETPTENTLVGAYEQRSGDEHGIVSTIRFWSWSDTPVPSRDSGRSARAPYQQIAFMTYPHGPKNHVDALALTKDGSVACTVSNSEKAFRIWEKNVVPAISGFAKDEEDGDYSPSQTWTCRYKVATPSGFSNYATQSNGVTFSDDGSILAISFGRIVTLWASDEAQLLTSFQEDNGADVEQVCFVNPSLHQDLILLQSKKGVSLRSPYGEYGSTANFRAWSWSLSNTAKMTTVSAADLVQSHQAVAISIYNESKQQSQVVLVDVTTGTPSLGDDESRLSVIKEIPGRITSLCAVGKPLVQSNWENKPPRHVPILLYAMMDTGKLIFLNDLKDFTLNRASSANEHSRYSQSAGPRLAVPLGASIGQKRQLAQPSLSNREDNTPKRMALDVFGITANEDIKNAGPTTNNLPLLSTNFVRTLVGRNLSRSYG